jgi:hypothetical protein
MRLIDGSEGNESILISSWVLTSISYCTRKCYTLDCQREKEDNRKRYAPRRLYVVIAGIMRDLIRGSSIGLEGDQKKNRKRKERRKEA